MLACEYQGRQHTTDVSIATQYDGAASSTWMVKGRDPTPNPHTPLDCCMRRYVGRVAWCSHWPSVREEDVFAKHHRLSNLAEARSCNRVGLAQGLKMHAPVPSILRPRQHKKTLNYRLSGKALYRSAHRVCLLVWFSLVYTCKACMASAR